ncbi:MAG: hypothetical protein LBG30_06395 [Odoribacteraceae bacterium]|jgi:Leucine-rich repeat (LRR) protein|nr:hypothetical protein [Odoribacteraceae bacterium]
MKKRIFYPIAVACLLLAAACGDKEHTPLLSVSPAELTFGREGGEATFDVASDSKWIISNGKTTWYECDKNAGENDATVKVTVSASPQAAAKRDTIHLAAGVTADFVVIKQQADYADITTFVADNNLKQALVALFDRDNNGKVSSAEVSTVKNVDLSNKQIANIDGLEYLPAIEQLNISNNTVENIDLAKLPFLISLDCSNNRVAALDLARTPDLASLNISGNDWASDSINIAGNAQLTSLNAANTGITYVRVRQGFTTDGFAYEPAGELRFRGATPPAIVATPAIISFAQDAVDVQLIVNVTSNVDWSVSGLPAWANISAVEGHDNAGLTVTVTSANTTYAERSQDFTISGEGQTVTVTIKQDGIPLPPLEVNKKRVDHPAAAGTESIEILSDKSYTITNPTDASWFSLSAASGSGATTVTLSFEANTLPYARLAYIDVNENSAEPWVDGSNISAIKRLIVRQEGNAVPQDDELLSTYLPDANFYNALKNLSGSYVIAKSGPGGEITVGDARAHTGNLLGSGMYNKSIASFVGIELFTNLKEFQPGGSSTNGAHNTAVILDLSKNLALTKLTASYMTELRAVDVSACTELTLFNVDRGLRTPELDFSTNTKLTDIRINGGSSVNGSGDVGEVRKIDLTKCPDLTRLDIACNKLTEIDISQNTKLAGTVHLGWNYLKKLDISNHPSIYTINLKSNRLEQFVVSPRAKDDQDMALALSNQGAYGTGKNFNNLSVIDASTCLSIYTIQWENLPNLTKIIIPIASIRDRANVSFAPADVSGIIIEEVDPTVGN